MEEVLICSICYEEFDNAKHLPRNFPQCGHTFCSLCLEKMLEKKETKCPLDKTNFSSPFPKIDHFPINYIAKELAEGRKGKGFCQKHKRDMAFACFTEKLKICQECLLEEGHFHQGHNLKTLDKIKSESIQPKKQLESILDQVSESDEQIKRCIEERRTQSLNMIKTTFEKIRNLLFIKENELSFEIDCFFDMENKRSNSFLSELKKDLEEKINGFKHIIEKDLLFEETLFEDTESYINRFSQEIEKLKGEMDVIQNKFDDNCRSFSELFRNQVEFWSQIKFPLIGLPEDLMNIFTQFKSEKSQWKIQNNITCTKAGVHLNVCMKDDQLMIMSDYKAARDIIEFEYLKEVKEIQIELKYSTSEAYDIKILNYILKRLEKVSPSISLKLNPCSYSQEFLVIFHELLSSFENVEIILENHQRVTGKSSLAPFINKIMGEDKKVSFMLNHTWLDVNDLKANNFQAFDAAKITKFTFELQGNEKWDPSVCQLFTSLPNLKILYLNFTRIKMEQRDIELLFKNTLHSAETLESFSLGLFETGLTDKMMNNFSIHAKNLKKLFLSIGSNSITDQALKFITANFSESLNILESFTLSLSQTLVTDEGVCQLFGNLSLPSVKNFKFFLNFTQISDKVVVKFVEHTFVSMKNLESFTLQLQNTKVTDSSLKRLFMNLKVLQELELNLQSTDITDEGVDCLKQILSPWKSLKKIDINLSNTKVSNPRKTEIEEIKRNLLQARKD